MILFFADGKLGNQLFQYAFLKTIAKENEKIISTNMKQFTELFEIENKKFKQITLNKYFNFLLRKFIKPYILSSMVKLKLISYIKQDRSKTSALPAYKKQKGLFPLTLVESNFFQSEDFFDGNKLDIFLRSEYIDEAKKLLNKIAESFTKVFVHVRRGDYIFEKYLGVQGIDLPKSYFFQAIESIKKEIGNPFFVFLSDDPSYVECCFSEIENKVISKNSMGVDLAIMSLCDAGICSNSSFSWWGAYLMSERKKVIMPKYWYGWKQKIESHVGIQPKWAEVLEVKI